MSFVAPGKLNALLFEIFRLNGRITAIGDEMVSVFGLTSARWQVMGVIELSSEPIAVPQIARMLGLTRQAVRRLVNELYADGLLAMFDNPNHKRAKIVRLTNEGQVAYARSVEKWSGYACAIEEELGIDRIDSALRTLQCLSELIEMQTAGS